MRHMKRTLACSILSTGLGLAALTGVADSSDASWQYVSPIPQEWSSRHKPGSYNASGVITNGNWRLFVSGSKNSLALSCYSGGWTHGGAYLDGSGKLDLSKPIYVEGTDERVYITSIPVHSFTDIDTITEFIAPKELTSVGSYTFYKDSVGCSGLTNVVFNCPNLKTIGDGVFRYCNNLKSIDISTSVALAIKSEESIGTFAYMASQLDHINITTTNSLSYGTWSFMNTMLPPDAQGSDLSLEYATEVKTSAFYVKSGLGISGFLKLSSLTNLASNAFRANDSLTGVELGYDALETVAEDAFYQSFGVELMVIGKGPKPLVLRKRLLDHYWQNPHPYRVYFRGDAPDASQLISGDYAFSDYGTRNGRFYIPYGNETWADIISEATPCTQAEFNAQYPDDHSEVIGTIASRVLGNLGVQYLCYGDYRAHESDLFVESEFPELCPVVPATGIHRQYKAGDEVILSAPTELFEKDYTKYQVSAYVVSRINERGEWVNAVTNAYDGGNASVTLPADGASIKVNWLFSKIAHRIALDPLFTADYPEEVTCSGAMLDADGQAYVAPGSVVTFTARQESPTEPKSYFVRWEGDIGDADATNPVLQVLMDAPRRLRAVFAHGWLMISDTQMTDGPWTLRVTKKGGEDLCLGYNVSGWYSAYVSYSGSLGRMDLSAPIHDVDGNSYRIVRMDACTLRGDDGYGKAKLGSNTVLKDLTLPTALQTLNEYPMLGNAGLTNLVAICPSLTTIPSGFASQCGALRRVVLVAPNVTTIVPTSGDYVPFRSCYAIQQVELDLRSVGYLPTFFLVSPMNETDASNWRLDSVTNLYGQTFDLNSSNPSSVGMGPVGTLRMPSLIGVTGERHFYGMGRLTGLELGSGRLRALGSNSLSTWGLSSLKELKLGLAPENVFCEDAFPSSAGITNVTFIAAPPATEGLFAALAVTHTVPEDGTKTLTYVADFDQPGWTDAYLSAMGIDTQVTDDEAAELAKLPRKERRWLRGVVWMSKRYAWLFAQPKKRGLVLTVR